jgi:hypothetical protein
MASSAKTGTGSVSPVGSGAKKVDLLAERDWLIEGFARALGRFKAEVEKGDADPQEMFIPLFEALHWAVSLSDRVGRSHFKAGSEREARDGIRFARNRVGHQWARAFELSDVPFPSVTTKLVGSSSQIIAPAVVKAWCWCDAKKLPVPPDPKHRNPTLEKVYTAKLQGRPALQALDVFAAAVERLRGSP